jgi:hypothetical protein
VTVDVVFETAFVRPEIGPSANAGPGNTRAARRAAAARALRRTTRCLPLLRNPNPRFPRYPRGKINRNPIERRS